MLMHTHTQGGEGALSRVLEAAFKWSCIEPDLATGIKIGGRGERKWSK